MIIFGFTGTQRGMTEKQLDTLDCVIFRNSHDPRKELFLHGGCIGADEQLHNLIRRNDWPDHNIEVYPSNIPSKQAYLMGFPHMHSRLPPLVRNEMMMKRATIIIATPRGMLEERRSGTWYAVRCARRMQRRPFKPRKKIILIFPNGNVTEE